MYFRINKKQQLHLHVKFCLGVWSQLRPCDVIVSLEKFQMQSCLFFVYQKVHTNLHLMMTSLPL